MTASPIRRFIAALGFVMMPLVADAQPAPLPPIEAFPIFLDPVSGDCSELNSRVATKGVTDAYGNGHPGFWGWTTYQLLINGLTIDEHSKHNYADLLSSFSIQKFAQQDSSGRRQCLRATGFEIEFQAQFSITRIHWDPLFPPCQLCATEWADLMTFIDSHERTHVADIRKALRTANSQWPGSSEWPSMRVIEVCGPAGAMITRNLGSNLMNEIGAQLKETWTKLESQIKTDRADLDSRDPYAAMKCDACSCQVPAECKFVTVSPSTMRGGAPASGDVTLLSAAPPGGADVLLRSDNPVASIPSQINVPEGGTNQTFGITLTPVQQTTPGFIYATRPGAGRICRVELHVSPPELVNLETPQSMVSGETKQGTVTLGTVAPTGGIKVQLEGDAHLRVPKDVVVPAGTLEAKFDIDAVPPRNRPGYQSQRIRAWLGAQKFSWTDVY